MKHLVRSFIIVFLLTGICFCSITVQAEENADSETAYSLSANDAGWHWDGSSWWYKNADGTYPAGCWQFIDGAWYHFDAAGNMQTGWIWDNSWYYLNPNGAMQTGWIWDGSWYYLQPDGSMAVGWIYDGSNWYYLHSSGAMLTGWIWDNGWYYLNPNGAMAIGWVWDGSGWYYMRQNGVMATGWILDKTDWYYMSSSGAMQIGWIWDGSHWYFMRASGAMMTGWLKDGDRTYYLDSSGAMVSGKQVIDGKTYVFDENGALQYSYDSNSIQASDLQSLSIEEILELVSPLFIEDQKNSGILASVSLGQFMLESATGKSELAQNANNLFGMKCGLSGNSWNGSAWDGVSKYTKETKEQNEDGSYRTISADFRKYSCIEDSIADHSTYLLGAKKGSDLRYKGIQGCTDYKQAAQIIFEGGYATSLIYVDTLCSIIEKWNLTQYDIK